MEPFIKLKFLADVGLLLQVRWPYGLTPPRCKDLLYHIYLQN